MSDVIEYGFRICFRCIKYGLIYRHENVDVIENFGELWASKACAPVTVNLSAPSREKLPLG